MESLRSLSTVFSIGRLFIDISENKSYFEKCAYVCFCFKTLNFVLSKLVLFPGYAAFNSQGQGQDSEETGKEEAG